MTRVTFGEPAGLVHVYEPPGVNVCTSVLVPAPVDPVGPVGPFVPAVPVGPVGPVGPNPAAATSETCRLKLVPARAMISKSEPCAGAPAESWLIFSLAIFYCTQ